jgi:hypothetical protein
MIIILNKDDGAHMRGNFSEQYRKWGIRGTFEEEEEEYLITRVLQVEEIEIEGQKNRKI